VVLVVVLVILVVVVLTLKAPNQAIVEHTDLDLVVVLVQVDQVIMLVVVAVLVQLEPLAMVVLEMVEQEKIIVQYLEQQ
tara:strand:+ start:175 stop:411 length:237 start_codon:yes stop_codon:yes gene_type:complete